MIIHNMRLRFDPLLAALKYLLEGIQLLVDSSSGFPVLGYVGIQHGADSTVGSLNLLNSSGHNISYEMPGKIGFFAQTETPRVFVAGLTNQLFVVDCRGVSPTQPSPKFYPTGLSNSDRDDHLTNDGICTPRGILYGTKAAKWLDFTGELNFVPFEGQPRVYHGKEKRQCSNGIVVLRIEGNELICAYIDSPVKKIEMIAINFVTGEYRWIRTIKDFSDGDAFPDGMRAAPGIGEITHLVVAFFNPGTPEHGVLREVEVATGEVTAEWLVPGAARVTCLDFFENADGSISIAATTADEGSTPEIAEANPNRGCIFEGPTHYPAGSLRKPSLVPDAWWQQFVAA